MDFMCYLLYIPLGIALLIAFIMKPYEKINNYINDKKMIIGGKSGYKATKISNKLRSLYFDYKKYPLTDRDEVKEIYNYFKEEGCTDCKFNSCYAYHPFNDTFPENQRSYLFFCYKNAKLCIDKCEDYKEKTFLEKYIFKINPEISYENFISIYGKLWYDIIRFDKKSDLSTFSKETREFINNRNYERRKKDMEEKIKRSKVK